jgi:hypothetical protein
VSDVRLEYSDTDFMKQWTGSNLMCVRSAVALGTFGFVVRAAVLLLLLLPDPIPDPAPLPSVRPDP